MILIGQVTKDSNVAGPRALEHIVDATLSLDGDKHTSLRLLRAVKNRFGSLEVAAFGTDRRRDEEVIDPSVLFQVPARPRWRYLRDGDGGGSSGTHRRGAVPRRRHQSQPT